MSIINSLFITSTRQQSALRGSDDIIDPPPPPPDGEPLDLTNANGVADGNSLFAGYLSETNENPIIFLKALLDEDFTGVTMQNFAVSGQTTQMMTDDAVAQVDSLIDDERFNILFVWEVINDIYFGGTPTDAVNRFKAYCNARRAAGWFVVTLTALPRYVAEGNWNGSKTGEQMAVDVDATVPLMLSNPDSYCDILINVRDYPELATWNSTMFNADKTHLKNAGNHFVAQIIKDNLLQKAKLSTPVLTLTTVNSTEITASSTTPSGATQFTFQLDDNSSFSSPTEFVQSGSNKTFSSLSPSTTYYGRVKVSGSSYLASEWSSYKITTTSPADIIAPTVTNAATTGIHNIAITFSEAVTATNVGWTFKQNGSTITPTSVSGSGTSTLNFTFSQTFAFGDTLLRSYAASTGNTIDTGSNELISFTDQAVNNNIPNSGGGTTDFFMVIGTSNTGWQPVTTITDQSRFVQVRPNTKIYNPGKGGYSANWESLNPGVNTMAENGVTTLGVGYETGLFTGLTEFEDTPRWVFKFGKGNSTMPDWAPNTGNCWNQMFGEPAEGTTDPAGFFLRACRSAQEQSKVLKLKAIIGIFGENDAKTTTDSDNFDDNYPAFWTAFATKLDEIGDRYGHDFSSFKNVVIRISDSEAWTYAEPIRTVLEDYVDASPSTRVLKNTDGLELAGDNQHYTSDSQMTIGLSIVDDVKNL